MKLVLNHYSKRKLPANYHIGVSVPDWSRRGEDVAAIVVVVKDSSEDFVALAVPQLVHQVVLLQGHNTTFWTVMGHYRYFPLPSFAEHGSFCC